MSPFKESSDLITGRKLRGKRIPELFRWRRKICIGTVMQTSISLSPKRAKCKRKFLRHFRDGYQGEKFISWEREYKWQAHLSWKEQLNREDYERLLDAKQFEVISNTAVKIETKTNLLFSFEKMALRDAVKSAQGAKAFAKGLYDYVYGTDNMESRFSTFGEVLDSLPRVQTRVHTWPLHTVFGFIANPRQFIFMKPRVTQVAALNYDFEFNYRSRPNWDSYQSLIAFAEEVRNDTADLRPRDYIDLQSFIWVMGSEEY